MHTCSAHAGIADAAAQVGTLVRLVLVVALPLAYLQLHDAAVFFAWWWLLVGLDWPAYLVQWGMLTECATIFLVAQVLQLSGGGLADTTRACIVAAIPIALRFTGLSLLPYVWVMALPLLVVAIALAMHTGCAVDVNRVLDWAIGAEFADDDGDDALEAGSASDARSFGRVPTRNPKKGE